MATEGSYRLELEPQKKNVFVTQLREDEEDDHDIRKFPIVEESASKLLDTGFNTVQSTLLLKKQVEVEKVQEDLEIKRNQFAERMAACKQKEEELKKKQTQIRERVGKFEKFIEENDAKRRRAIQKYQTELKLKNQKNRELDVLSTELEQLKARNMALQAKLAKCSVYEKFLMKVLDQLPEDYLEANDAMLMGIMMRFRTLSATNQTLVQMLVDKSDQVEAEQQRLQDMNQEHTQSVLLMNSQLASLQEKLEDTVQKKEKIDQFLVNSKGIFRQQSELLGCIKMSIDNIADKCQRLRSIPVESLDIDSKLKVIQEHIVEHTDIVKLARLPESASTGDGLLPSTSSILKNRLSRHVLLDSPLKSSASRGFKNVQLALRFAADVKQS
ncbi:coiled-coil domain-containing protein 42 homolog [Montipora capricornis]|uniref:coiled-coil domain-containing protein 42 homolog n=2 Tax=Montipora capricornis TaxID=246305 RepID=UPI0035F14DD8